MIEVTFRDNINRSTDIIDENTTVRAAVESHGFDLSTGMLMIDGERISGHALDKTFAELGYVNKSCYISKTQKLDNAA